MTTTSTLLRDSPTGEVAEERLRPQGFRSGDAFELAGAAFGSFCLAFLLYERLTPLSGGLGFFASWYGFFLAMTWFMARSRLGQLEARDQPLHSSERSVQARFQDRPLLSSRTSSGTPVEPDVFLWWSDRPRNDSESRAGA